MFKVVLYYISSFFSHFYSWVYVIYPFNNSSSSDLKWYKDFHPIIVFQFKSMTQLYRIISRKGFVFTGAVWESPHNFFRIYFLSLRMETFRIGLMCYLTLSLITVPIISLHHILSSSPSFTLNHPSFASSISLSFIPTSSILLTLSFICPVYFCLQILLCRCISNLSSFKNPNGDLMVNQKHKKSIIPILEFLEGL